MATIVTSIRLPEDLHGQIEELARATRRTKNYLLTEAISRYLEEEAWQLMAVDEGIRSSETEPLTTQDDVIADLLRRGQVTEESLAEARTRLAAP